MAGDAGPPPDPATLEGKIHAQFPEAHQKVLAMCGVYFGVYLLAKLGSGGSKEEEKPVASAAPAAGASDDDVPSVYSEKFDEWIGQAGNAEKYAVSLGGGGEERAGGVETICRLRVETHATARPRQSMPDPTGVAEEVGGGPRGP